jgi:hypothetical protein
MLYKQIWQAAAAQHNAMPLYLSPIPFQRAGVHYEADFGSMVQRRTSTTSSTERRIRRVEVEEVTRQPAPVLPTQAEQKNDPRSVHALVASEPLQWVTQPAAVVAPQAATAAAAAPTAAAAAAASAATVAAAAVRVGQKRRRSGVVAIATATAAAGNSAGGSSTSTTGTTATAVHKYELHGGPVLNTSVTLDTVMFSLAAGLFERGMLPVAPPVVGAYGAYGTAAAGAYGMPGYGYAPPAAAGYAMPANNSGSVQKVDVYCSAVTQAKYDAKRQQFAAQGISTAESWVFHGTPTPANVHSIMTEGFKVMYTILECKHY